MLVPENRTLKHTLIRSAIFRLTRRGSFSLRRGLDSIYVLLELGIILFSLVFGLRNDEGDPLGRPRCKSALCLGSSAGASLRGRSRSRTSGRGSRADGRTRATTSRRRAWEGTW
jgi:hypothetical protein